jgi:hypothetical protein
MGGRWLNRHLREFAHSIPHDSFDPIVEKIHRRLSFELRQFSFEPQQ